ncbi:MAG: hypothetical protein JSS02_22795 [Planctomycetes bacterium]|nr:hypothetical protein [Planctomycetota bacterium]
MSIAQNQPPQPAVNPMPVNPLPVLIPLVCIWAAIVFVLMRWWKCAGWLLSAGTALLIAVWFLNTSVERPNIEPMRFETEFEGTVFLTTARGERLTVNSQRLIALLHGQEGTEVRVAWVGTYDWGRLRAYSIQAIDGVAP